MVVQLLLPQAAGSTYDCYIYLFIGSWELDLPINPTGPKQCRVENIYTIRRHDNLELLIRCQ